MKPEHASHEALMVFAEMALQRVLTAREATRDVALDLLSSDAFVTYAFEAAADEPAAVAKRADAAMRRISDCAAGHLPPSTLNRSTSV